MHGYRLAQIEAWCGEGLRDGTVVDLGAGGGLLAEPLARVAARVIGVDRSVASLVVARAHDRRGDLLYLRGDVLRTPLGDGCADVVVCADVVEHVPDVAGVIAEAARLLRAGGLLYVSTINRTRWATLLAVWVAEGLRLLPKGTHDPMLFVRPEELAQAGAAVGLTIERVQGEAVRVLATLRGWAIRLRPATSVRVGYAALLRKRGVPHLVSF